MTAIFTETPVVGWIERRVPAPSDMAFYRIGDGPGRAAARRRPRAALHLARRGSWGTLGGAGLRLARRRRSGGEDRTAVWRQRDAHRTSAPAGRLHPRDPVARRGSGDPRHRRARRARRLHLSLIHI